MLEGRPVGGVSVGASEGQFTYRFD
jgi:hypothetical protein